MREKFLYLISSGHWSNEACLKCFPPDQASEIPVVTGVTRRAVTTGESEREEERELRRREREGEEATQSRGS